MILVTLIAALACAMILMLLLWLKSGKGKQAEWVDFGWTALIGLLACYFAIVTTGTLSRRIVLGILPAIWSLRLASHIYYDRIGNGRGDTRYEQLHADWGAEYRWRFLVFFQMQAVLAFLLVLPFYLAGSSFDPLSTPYLVAGVLIFAIAAIGETIADRQLARFKAQPENKGKVCKEGLWRYSRHPNYFFEWIHWISYVVLVWQTDFWWASLGVSLVMLTLVVFVTGIPPTEASSLKSRGSEFRKYQQTTSAFFPWFPKKREVL